MIININIEDRELAKEIIQDIMAHSKAVQEVIESLSYQSDLE